MSKLDKNSIQGLIPGKHLGTCSLLPAKPGTCPECAVAHEPDQPHNQQSLFYQYKFFNDNGRWPTWTDAMVHCTEEVKAYWTEALKEAGVAGL